MSFVLNLQRVNLYFSSTLILCFFETPNFYDASLLVIPFSICLMISYFCINLTHAFLIQNKIFTPSNILVAIEFSNFKRFDYIWIFKYRTFLFYLLCKSTLRRVKVRDGRRNSRKGPSFCSRQRKIRDREARYKEIKIV